jgi:mono/diheme cytochrome c family protein
MTPGRFPLVVLASVSLMVTAGAQAQRPSRGLPDVLTIESLAGKDTFDAYCATCHGRMGDGLGPVAPVLRQPPADLRRLTAKYGAFPRDLLVQYVTGTGREITAHGSSDMPVWGPVFRSLDPSDARIRIRIRNVLDYVESLQQP